MKEESLEIKTSHVFMLFLFLSLILHFMAAGLVWYFEPKLHSSLSSQNQAAEEIVVLKTKILNEQEYQRRIVETDRSRQKFDAPPDIPAKYQGEFTQRVEKEMVAPGFGSQAAPQTSSARKNKPAPPPRVSALEKFGTIPLITPPEEEIDYSASFNSEPKKDYGQSTGELGHGNLDFLEKEVATGSQTLLNTDEYKYAGFFNRFKREVAPRWEPMIQNVLKKQGRQIKKGLYETRTRFTLDSDGTILGVEILSSSSVAAFDEAARSSIMQVLRIKNPPASLREGDGKYRIELGFMVNLDNVGMVFNYVPDPRLPE